MSVNKDHETWDSNPGRLRPDRITKLFIFPWELLGVGRKRPSLSLSPANIIMRDQDKTPSTRTGLPRVLQVGGIQPRFPFCGGTPHAKDT